MYHSVQQKIVYLIEHLLRSNKAPEFFKLVSIRYEGWVIIFLILPRCTMFTFCSEFITRFVATDL